MSLLDTLSHVTASAGSGPLAYAVAGLAAALDPILPVIPAETILISAAVLSARPGGPLIWVLIPVGAAGAIAGDNAMYWAGRLLGERGVRRLVRGQKGSARLRWATERMRRHGPMMIVVGRYIPGGRTAVTLAAGMLEMPWRRFIVADAAAGITWATYACLLGRIGGAAFEHNTWAAILLAAGIAGLLTLALEGWRRVRSRSP